MITKCKICGHEAGLFNLDDGACKTCTEKELSMNNPILSIKNPSKKDIEKILIMLVYLSEGQASILEEKTEYYEMHGL